MPEPAVEVLGARGDGSVGGAVSIGLGDDHGGIVDGLSANLTGEPHHLDIPLAAGVRRRQPHGGVLARHHLGAWWNSAVEDAEHLVHPVGAQPAVHCGPVTGGQLRVETMNEGLVGLAPIGESDTVVIRPRPGLFLGSGGRERLDQVRRVPVAEQAQSVDVAWATWRGLGEIAGVHRTKADYSRPEPLHLAQVPQQVGSVPVRAAGDALARIHPP